MPKKKLNPEALFNFASDFAKRSELAGKGSEYPTFRQCADEFGVSLQAIEDAIEDFSGIEHAGYMDAVVAIQVGNGIAKIERKADYLVEAYQ